MSSAISRLRQLAAELHQEGVVWSTAKLILQDYTQELLKYGNAVGSTEILSSVENLNKLITRSRRLTGKLLSGVDRGLEFVDYFTSKGSQDEEKKTGGLLFADTLADPSSLEQIALSNAKIDATVQRQRLLPKVITGERVLRTRLEYDNLYPTLTGRERVRNRMFMNQFSWVEDGIGGVGHQQPLPFEFGLPSRSHLDYRNKFSQALRYAGDLCNGGVYVRKHVYPTEQLQRIFQPSLIRKTAIWQRRMNQFVDAAGPGDEFIMKETNDLMPPEVARRSLKNRLYFQTLVDGKWT